jgi:excisionase family DNA binding protein
VRRPGASPSRGRGPLSADDLAALTRAGAELCEAAKYITPEELAAWLKCSKKSVYRLAEQDPTVPVLRLGRLVRFPRERLERWLASREQGRGRGPRLPKPLPVPSQVPMPTRVRRRAMAPCAIPCATDVENGGEAGAVERQALDHRVAGSKDGAGTGTEPGGAR